LIAHFFAASLSAELEEFHVEQLRRASSCAR
jgi:hypothetical protein